MPFFIKQKAAFFYLLSFSMLSLTAESISEKSVYPSFCSQAAKDEAVFADFKRNPIYRNILEHVSYKLGWQYLDVIKKEDPEALALFEKFRENDTLGNPIVYDYGEYGYFSPTTLRYIKVACDLKKEFGDLSRMNIVEIGGGYGGLCKVIHELCGFKSYTLIDLEPCNHLAKKYLETLHVGNKNVFFLPNTNIRKASSYDLVISNYGFSEISEDEQKKYLKYIINKTPQGYMTMNFISHLFSVNSISADQLVRTLCEHGKMGKVIKEIPLTHPDNLLITWKPASSPPASPPIQNQGSAKMPDSPIH